MRTMKKICTRVFSCHWSSFYIVKCVNAYEHDFKAFLSNAWFPPIKFQSFFAEIMLTTVNTILLTYYSDSFVSLHEITFNLRARLSRSCYEIDVYAKSRSRIAVPCSFKDRKSTTGDLLYIIYNKNSFFI